PAPSVPMPRPGQRFTERNIRSPRGHSEANPKSTRSLRLWGARSRRDGMAGRSFSSRGGAFAIMNCWQLRQILRPWRPNMHKTVVGITSFALVALGAAGCVSKSEYNKSVQAAQTRYDALDATNTRLKSELADAGKRNEQLTADRAELERDLSTKSGELGKN